MIRTELSLDVRYYETDQMGIVHHSNYIRYFECGRNAMLSDAGLPIEEIEKAGVMMPVVAVECRYRTPARMGDTLKIISTIASKPMAKVVVESEIYNQNNDLVCSGAVTLGFIDAATRRPVRCPAVLSDFFDRNI